MSVHGCLVGASGCGKSRFAREVLIPGQRRRGVGALILDPIGQSWGPPDPAGRWETRDPREWIARLKASRRTFGFVDECGQHIGKKTAQGFEIAQELAWSATVSRNQGIVCCYSAQRMTQIPTEFRDQCGWGYLFMMKRVEADRACETFNLDPRWADRLVALPDGWCYEIRNSFTPPRLLQVFQPKLRQPDPGMVYTRVE